MTEVRMRVRKRNGDSEPVDVNKIVRAVERWTVAQGASELASDALIDNFVSHRMHAALGFEETERVVAFRKRVG